MMSRPLPAALPADLPTNWQMNDTVSPQGTNVGLTKQHGYNYLMEQVNKVQEAANTINGAFDNVPDKDDLIPKQSRRMIYPSDWTSRTIKVQLTNAVKSAVLWISLDTLTATEEQVLAVTKARLWVSKADAEKDIITISYFGKKPAIEFMLYLAGIGTSMDPIIINAFPGGGLPESNHRILTLAAAGWSDSYPYSQTAEAEGVTADDDIKVVGVYIPDGAAIDQVKAWNKAAGFLMYSPDGVADGKVTFKAYKKPAVDFQVITEGA